MPGHKKTGVVRVRRPLVSGQLVVFSAFGNPSSNCLVFIASNVEERASAVSTSAGPSATQPVASIDLGNVEDLTLAAVLRRR